MFNSMRETRKSWPLRSAHLFPPLPEKDLSYTRFKDLEAQYRPNRPPLAHVPSGTRLCDSDLEKQRFDRELRPKNSYSTLSSGCETIYEPPDHFMENSRLLAPGTLPPERGRAWYRMCRWRICTPYHRLFSVVFVVNVIVMGFILSRVVSTSTPSVGKVRPQLSEILTAVSANLTASIAIRNEHVVNLLFKMFVTRVTPQFPLRLRRVFAKVYHFGGVHSGGGVMAVIWYGVYAFILMHDFISTGCPTFQIPNVVFTVTIWILMVALLTAAYPRIRARLHDWFELSHRFFGWSILLLFWGQTVVFVLLDSHRSPSQAGRSLVRLPVFWMLFFMSAAIIYPWIWTRRVKVRCELLSTHAIRMHVVERRTLPMQPCRVIAISHSPLTETHKFATIPDPDGGLGYSMVISRAGDWTSRLISNPPDTIWIKGAPTWGVLRIATMFDPVVIVATGSGIGPCLGLFNGYPNLPCRIFWQGKTPMVTYGKGIVDTVRKADPRAVIVDSHAEGRRDLAYEALKLYRESRAEAVIVISNTAATKTTVHALESRGVPAFGPIWDS